ncbi:MAG: hypothetical protein AAF799_05465 [Myxococcota bacterium]
MGCGPDVVATRSDDGGTTSDATELESTGSPTSSTSTSEVDTTESPPIDGTGLDEPGVSFVDDADIGVDLDCDPYAQDCPAGQKCAWWGSDGGGAWNSTRCVPIADDPAEPGEPCTVEGSGTTGLDDCRLGSMCWDVDPKLLEGTCVEQCTGDESNPSCENPQTTCAISADGLALCLPSCNPLQPSDCPEEQGCYPISTSWRCAPDASGDLGAYGDPCEFINTCDPGLVCVSPSAVPGCKGFGCCTDVCDLDEPECKDMELGVECTPWTDENSTPIGYEDVGVCALPQR